MRCFTAIFLSCIALSFIVSASESDLNIRVEAIKDRQSVYASAADLLSLELFTPESAELEKRYALAAGMRRKASVSGIFAGNDIDVLPGNERIRIKAEDMGLFKNKPDSEIYYRPIRENESRPLNPVIVGIAIVLLCFVGFFLSRMRHKRNKGRKDVHNGDYEYKEQYV